MLEFSKVAVCETTRARAGLLKFPHNVNVPTPVFMPVGTQGGIKGLLASQVKNASCSLILGNTYHLGLHPGLSSLRKMKGMKRLYCWNYALLTDSGGFQMVSLSKLSTVSEDGVLFTSPRNSEVMLLTPELSMEFQNAIGSDIIMQLDDVVSPKSEESRIVEAMNRSIRWLERAKVKVQTYTNQSLFPIVQGGTNIEYRNQSITGISQCDFEGVAIGGLCGGEEKEKFWETISYCTSVLANNKPIYSMGVGYLTDILVCVALGVDMFDCVYPTRTARFGTAFVPEGSISLKSAEYEDDFHPISETCNCYTCLNYSRAYLHAIVTRDTVGCHLVTIHNIHFYMNFMKGLRDSIIEQRFPMHAKAILNRFYSQDIPSWIDNVFRSIGIEISLSK